MYTARVVLSVTVIGAGNFRLNLTEVEIPTGVVFSSILKSTGSLNVDERFSALLTVKVEDDDNTTFEANTTFSKYKICMLLAMLVGDGPCF